MDNASDYGSEDSRFESWQVRCFCWVGGVKTQGNIEKNGYTHGIASITRNVQDDDLLLYTLLRNLLLICFKSSWRIRVSIPVPLTC